MYQHLPLGCLDMLGPLGKLPPAKFRPGGRRAVTRKLLHGQPGPGPRQASKTTCKDIHGLHTFENSNAAYLMSICSAIRNLEPRA